MDINKMIILIVIAVLYIATLIILLRFIKPYIDKKLDIKDKEVKNKKYELFATLDPDSIEEKIDTYIERYINRYIVYKFISNKAIYIKQEEVEVMIKDLTKLVYIEISELYVFYISTIVSINDNDDLVKYIHSKVQSQCIDVVSNYNNASV